MLKYCYKSYRSTRKFLDVVYLHQRRVYIRKLSHLIADAYGINSILKNLYRSYPAIYRKAQKGTWSSVLLFVIRKNDDYLIWWK